MTLIYAGFRAAHRLANVFSYFTNLSNIAAATVLLAGGVLVLSGRGGVNDRVRGAVVVVHQIMPVVLVLDWLLDPPRTPIRLRQAATWLVFPLAYLAYTLIRGPFVDWYPYPFLDPTRSGGYERVALPFVVMGTLLVWLGNVLRDRRARHAAPVLTVHSG